MPTAACAKRESPVAEVEDRAAEAPRVTVVVAAGHSSDDWYRPCRRRRGGDLLSKSKQFDLVLELDAWAMVEHACEALECSLEVGQLVGPHARLGDALPEDPERVARGNALDVGAVDPVVDQGVGHEVQGSESAGQQRNPHVVQPVRWYWQEDRSETRSKRQRRARDEVAA